MKPVTISGIVRRGKQLGRTIGFPTVNLALEEGFNLPFGVYVSTVEAEGIIYKGVTNAGRHPTAPEGSATIETYILDANPELYDKLISVTLLEFLRPETRFESLEALKAQLENDKLASAKWFESR